MRVRGKSTIQVRGNQFVINGEKRPYFMRSSFCLLGFYQQGERDQARRWLDRLKDQGFDGPRVFGENEDWFFNDKPIFFGNRTYTTEVVAWDVPAGDVPASSKIKLKNGYEKFVWQLAEDLIERDMVAEFCCNATAKSWKDSGWTSHGLNKFAQMFAKLFPDPRQTPFLHEAINEADAHLGWEYDDEWRRELKRIGPRWRRSSDELSHHNYPWSTIGVSAGGQYLPGFDDIGYTHRNIHPPRGTNWQLGPDGQDIGEYAKKTIIPNATGRPVAFNETVHYMTPEQWNYWTNRVPKWIGLSTRDVGKLIQYYHTLLAAGISVCVHDMIGMGTWPEEPLSHLEVALQREFGPAKPAPDPDPDPDKPIDPPDPVSDFRPWEVKVYAEIVSKGYLEILKRAPDSGGFRYYTRKIHEGMSEARFREVLLRSDEFRRVNKL